MSSHMTSHMSTHTHIARAHVVTFGHHNALIVVVLDATNVVVTRVHVATFNGVFTHLRYVQLVMVVIAPSAVISYHVDADTPPIGPK